MQSRRFIQLTDPHLLGDSAGTLRGVPTLSTFEQTLAQARRRDWPVDGLLLTGDLVQDDPTGYAHFPRLFGPHSVPVLCVPGNHDDAVKMRRALAREPFIVEGHVDFDPWRIVLLDSSVPGSAGGRLSAQTLADLNDALGSAPSQHALVCLHHHPVPMESRWLDEVGLENAAEFFDVIDRHRNVRAILWGHVHQQFDGVRNGVRLMATPSTCSQFLPRSDDFALDPRPPAYRTLELQPDGSVSTEIVWMDSCTTGSSSPSSASSVSAASAA